MHLYHTLGTEHHANEYDYLLNILFSQGNKLDFITLGAGIFNVNSFSVDCWMDIISSFEIKENIVIYMNSIQFNSIISKAIFT